VLIVGAHEAELIHGWSAPELASYTVPTEITLEMQAGQPLQRDLTRAHAARMA